MKRGASEEVAVSAQASKQISEASEAKSDAQNQKDAPGEDSRPRKKYYRCRAHANPYSGHSFPYPVAPEYWTEPATWYPQYQEEGKDKLIRFTDIGCGFGGLLFNLSPLFPDKLLLGIEIRPSVCQYVIDRVEHMRQEHAETQQYQNIWAIRSNAMKYLPNYFRKGQVFHSTATLPHVYLCIHNHNVQLEKMFFCFPDPHFKKKKQRRRIISHSLLSEYAYVLQPGGRVYTITDVEDLHNHMNSHLTDHPLFTPVPEDKWAEDVCVEHIQVASEEAKKVGRNEGKKYITVFERVPLAAS